MTVSDILTEPLLVAGTSRSDADRRVQDLLDQVQLPADAGQRLPREFSGGQRQRIAIARALSRDPKVIVCDEPVSALDLSNQGRVLDLFIEIQQRTQVAYLFITHDLSVVRHISHRVAVMYRGEILETGPAAPGHDGAGAPVHAEAAAGRAGAGSRPPARAPGGPPPAGRGGGMSLPNPALPGFYPDPSICRVGDDYYLACSTFEYLPGIPVFHSTDLASWALVGHVADRPGQLDPRVPTLGGAWAPTIRFRDGVFHVVVTDAMGRGTLLFTAADPAGPWSDGLELEVPGIDPDLAWDADGTAYITYSGLLLDSRRAPGHPAGADRPGDRRGARGAALAVVGHRAEVPRGAAPLRDGRHLVPDDRRGRHGARARRVHRPRAGARRAVRGLPGATRC